MDYTKTATVWLSLKIPNWLKVENYPEEITMTGQLDNIPEELLLSGLQIVTADYSIKPYPYVRPHAYDKYAGLAGSFHITWQANIQSLSASDEVLFYDAANVGNLADRLKQIIDKYEKLGFRVVD